MTALWIFLGSLLAVAILAVVITNVTERQVKKRLMQQRLDRAMQEQTIRPISAPDTYERVEVKVPKPPSGPGAGGQRTSLPRPPRSRTLRRSDDSATLLYGGMYGAASTSPSSESDCSSSSSSSDSGASYDSGSSFSDGGGGGDCGSSF